MMRVLVTGATGYLGRAITVALRREGHHPVAFARHASTAHLDVECIDGDVTDAAAVDRAVGSCDAVCHGAALVSIWQRDRRRFDSVNVDGSRHVFDAVARHGLARCVYTSSFLALPPAGRAAALEANDYQRTKVAALALARSRIADGSPIVVLVPGVIYGPGGYSEANLVGRLLVDRCRGRLPFTVGIDRVWSFSYVDDVAAAHVAAIAGHGSRSVYGVGGANLPQRAIYDWLARERGVAAPGSLPASAARPLAWVEELRARLTGHLPLITRGTIAIAGHDWPIASDDAVRDLGYRVTPLEDGLARAWASLRDAAGRG